MTYDVFVSFHDDTHKNFTAFLFQALSANGIDTFRYNGKKGESITHEVLKAIQGSGIFIVVFSKNYASSTWCLLELTKICNCVETLQRLVLPIFYDVDPSEVRKQSGCYKEAFAKHVEKLREDKEKLEELQRWRESLTQVANLSGWDIRNEIERAEGVYMQIEEAFAKYVKKFRKNEELMEELHRCRESLTRMANLSDWHIININTIERAEGVYMKIKEAFGKHVKKLGENIKLLKELQRCKESLTQMAYFCGWNITNKIREAERVYMQIKEAFGKHLENEELMEELQRSKESLTQMAIFGDWVIINKIERAEGVYMQIEEAFAKYVEKFKENEELKEELHRCRESLTQMANLRDWHIIHLNTIERNQEAYMRIEEAIGKHVEKFRENKELIEELQRCKESLTQMAYPYGWDITNKIERAEGVYMQIEEAFAKYVKKFRKNEELMEELHRCRESLTQMAYLSDWHIINIKTNERAERVYMQIEEAFGKHVKRFRENKELMEELQRCKESLTQMAYLCGWDITNKIRRAEMSYMQIKEAFGKHLENKKLMEKLHICKESLTEMAYLCGWDITSKIEIAEEVYMQIEEAFAIYVEKFRENKELMEELQRYRESLTQMAKLSDWDIININSIEKAKGVYMQIEEAFGKDRENKELMEELQRCKESLTQMANLRGWDIINKIERGQRVYMQIHEELFAEYVKKFRKNEELMEELQRCKESLAQMAIFGDWDNIKKIEPALIKEVVEAVLRKVPPLPQKLPPPPQKLPPLPQKLPPFPQKLPPFPQKLPPRYPKKHDVFLSFRGDDTRLNFTSHLYKALNDEKIKTYMDNQLEKGGEISQALIEAIEDSYVSVVIFSENYASSKWCLGELNKILECKKVQEQIVIPVFYNIDPSHVRNQTGSYKQAFAKHEGDPRCNKWRYGLTEAANLAGFDSRNRIETEFIKDIVEDVLQKLAPMYPNQRKQPIGIEQTYEQIESLLKIGSSEDKITIGIWGMGGIGKTTLARTLYDNLSCKFEGCWFLENVRERSNKLEDLCDQLFSGLLKNKNHGFGNFEIRRLKRKKVFIVLDDVASSQQLDRLINGYDFLGPGSRVIVTARDKQILARLDEIYPVEKLSSDYSLQLFCLNAFGKEQPEDGFEDLSSRVVSYCKGIPLALKVLGASLYKKDEYIWKSELRKLGKIQNLEIHKVLRLSYDGLDPYEQDIFLDIACFFKGWHRDRLTSLLEACDFCPVRGIDTLLDKSLITISYDNRIEMHDLIQEMGWKIVDKDIKDPGERSRLWRHDEVLEVLEDNTVTRAVKGILFDLWKLTSDINLSSISLANMKNVRYLMIQDSCGRSNGFKLCLPDGESLLSNKLRCLHWDGFCLDSLPPTFRAKHLVELRMRDSKLKKLWDRVQDLVNLKTIDLSYSRNLMEIPNLSKADKLESVYLIDCESLCQLHVQSKSLCVVRLDGCSSLKKFSMTSVEITELNLDNTAICTLPPSIWCSAKLASLSLKGWKDLNFVENIGHSSSLEELDLSGTNIVEISPKIFEKLSMLKRLRLDDCDQLKSLPELPISLQEVSAVNCTSLDTEITQQLVLLHMSQNRIPGHFIFPGSHFVEDCAFHTTGSSITINCLPKSNFCGLIYCFILSKHGKGFRTIPVSCCICQDDIQIIRDDKAITCGSNLISDHVLFSYVDISQFDRISEVRDNFSVIFEFDHYDETIEFRHDQQRIKGYDLFPVYATERGFNKLIRSMVEFYEPELKDLRMEMRRARTSQ